jgi:hypothetical protein
LLLPCLQPSQALCPPFVQPPPQGQAALLVVEGQLALLLRLALAGPPAARASSAQRLFALHAIPKLGACKGLDLQPEEPGFGLRSGGLGAVLLLLGGLQPTSSQ